MAKDIEGHRSQVLEIYSEIFTVLSKDRDKRTPLELEKLEAANLKSPKETDFAKAVAVLRSILCSELGCFYTVGMEGSQSVGAFITHRLTELGLETQDLTEYLRLEGWF